MSGQSSPAVVKIGATIEGRGGRTWLRIVTDRVLNSSNRVLNLTPLSPEEQKKALCFGLASGLFDAGLLVVQVNSGINDPALTVVVEDESASVEHYREIARHAQALLKKAGCDVIVDRELPHNLLV